MSDVDTDVSRIEGIDGTIPAPGGKQERRRLALAVGAVVLLVGAGGAAYATLHRPTNHHHTLTGTLVLSDYDARDACNPTDTYSDVSDGAPVIVKDDGGTTIAQGSLDRGTVDKVPFTHNRCRHTFAVTVPETAFYHISIGRRDFAYSKADLAAKHWAISLSLYPPSGVG